MICPAVPSDGPELTRRVTILPVMSITEATPPSGKHFPKFSAFRTAGLLDGMLSLTRWYLTYQAKSKTMSRGMPALFTRATSAARVSRMLAFSAAYFWANSKSPVA